MLKTMDTASMDRRPKKGNKLAHVDPLMEHAYASDKTTNVTGNTSSFSSSGSGNETDTKQNGHERPTILRVHMGSSTTSDVATPSSQQLANGKKQQQQHQDSPSHTSPSALEDKSTFPNMRGRTLSPTSAQARRAELEGGSPSDNIRAQSTRCETTAGSTPEDTNGASTTTGSKGTVTPSLTATAVSPPAPIDFEEAGPLTTPGESTEGSASTPVKNASPVDSSARNAQYAQHYHYTYNFPTLGHGSGAGGGAGGDCGYEINNNANPNMNTSNVDTSTSNIYRTPTSAYEGNYPVSNCSVNTQGTANNAMNTANTSATRPGYGASPNNGGYYAGSSYYRGAPCRSSPPSYNNYMSVHNGGGGGGSNSNGYASSNNGGGGGGGGGGMLHNSNYVYSNSYNSKRSSFPNGPPPEYSANMHYCPSDTDRTPPGGGPIAPTSSPPPQGESLSSSCRTTPQMRPQDSFQYQDFRCNGNGNNGTSPNYYGGGGGHFGDNANSNSHNGGTVGNMNNNNNNTSNSNNANATSTNVPSFSTGDGHRFSNTTPNSSRNAISPTFPANVGPNLSPVGRGGGGGGAGNNGAPLSLNGSNRGYPLHQMGTPNSKGVVSSHYSEVPPPPAPSNVVMNGSNARNLYEANVAVPDEVCLVQDHIQLQLICEEILWEAERTYHEMDYLGRHAMSAENCTTVALDLEGEELGRHGTICIITLATKDFVYLIDLVELGAEALSPNSLLRTVLECPYICKLMYDCRADCDALFFIYEVRLRHVCDLQVAACYSGSHSDYLPSMKDVFNRLGLLQPSETHIKEQGRAFFDYRLGGSKEQWTVRPLAPLLIHYCAVDVKYFFRAQFLLSAFSDVAVSIGEQRLASVCAGHFFSSEKGNARREFEFL